MYELWARKRPVDGRGYPYEFIFNFDNEEYKYSALDTLDKEIYQEAMVVKDNSCVMYVEWEIPFVKRKAINVRTTNKTIL